MNPSTDVANHLPWNHLTGRLAQIGLLPHDVGGSGDCFFKSVSHQLLAYADLHTEIRMAGINHLQNHPELYIDSISDDTWENYINRMSILQNALSNNHSLFPSQEKASKILPAFNNMDEEPQSSCKYSSWFCYAIYRGFL